MGEREEAPSRGFLFFWEKHFPVPLYTFAAQEPDRVLVSARPAVPQRPAKT